MIRAYPERRGLTVRVGRWACRYTWSGARFANGSRWSSGWHDWLAEQ